MIKKLSSLFCFSEMKNVLKTLLAASLFVILASCGNGDGEWESGGGYDSGSRTEKAFLSLQISLKENSQRKVSVGEGENLEKIDCAASGIEKISARVSRAGEKELDFGPFDCSLGEATISNGLTPGVVTLTLQGLNPSGKAIYRGVGNDLTLVTGLNPVIIQMAPLTDVVNNTPAAITAFSLGGVQGVIDEASKSIAVTLPAGAAVTALSATFSTTGKIVDVGGSVQKSGVTSNDFTNPVLYTVTAEDDTKTSYTVTVTVAPVSDKAITAFSLGGVQGIINETAKSISVTMPNGSDLTSLAALFETTGESVSQGGVVQNNGVTVNDFTNPLTYLVTATDGSTASYTVTVRVALKSEKAITSFSFSDLTCVIDETTRSISVTMPYGTDISGLVATFTTTGESVLKGGIVQKSGQTVNNFTNPVTYRVTAADKTTADYTVTVSVAPNSAKAITAFSLSGATGGNGVPGVIDEGAKSISLTVPFGTDIKRLVATYTTTGKSVDVGGALQSNGQTANDFSSPVTYRITAVDETTVDYTVTVLVALNSAKAITAFSVSGVIDEGAKSIAVTVPYGTDITNIAATYTATGESVSKGGVIQESGVTQNDFTNPLIYRVTAADGTTASYTVTMSIALNSAKAITAFSVSGVPGVIDETARSILVTMPFATDISTLVATFTTTGDKVNVSGAAQSSGQTSNDFTNPLIYRVMAVNGTTANYTITVEVSLNPAKSITAFSVSGVPGIIREVAKTITVVMPRGTDVTTLVAAFATTGAGVKVGTVSQTSGVLANNFTSPVIYTVTAADGTTVLYTVTVVFSFKLPDTGQTTSSTTTFGEDHDYTINPPAYTDNGDGTVTDKVTGLMWQQADDGLTYNWYQASGTPNPYFNPGAAKDVCGSLTTGGYQDWRLPGRLELVSIVDRGLADGSAFNSSYFFVSKFPFYWTSTSYAGNSSSAWYLYNNGKLDPLDTPFSEINRNKIGPGAVRCVRDGQ